LEKNSRCCFSNAEILKKHWRCCGFYRQIEGKEEEGEEVGEGGGGGGRTLRFNYF
jgi:hypothetical protein